jgi:predicted GIY-YIG superfamily endonuclease
MSAYPAYRIPDAADARSHYVYQCFDATGQLLYVGCTQEVEDRIYHLTHECNYGKQPNRALYHLMASHTSESYPDKASARAAEREAIRTGRPLLNKQHNPSRFRRTSVREGNGYALVEPVHPITAQAFPDLIEVHDDALADA